MTHPGIHLPNTRDRVAQVQLVAVVAAATAAILYALIGLGVLWIGTSTKGTNTDLGAFGAITGITFAVIAVLLARFRSRLLWAAVGVVQVIVIVGYLVVASVRDPSFEAWGLIIRACQVVLFVSMAYLLLHPVDDAADPG